MSKDLYSPLSSNIHIKDIGEYKKLYTESIKNPKDFFGKLAKENIAWFKDFDEVHNDKFSNTKWFKGGKTNLSFNSKPKIPTIRYFCPSKFMGFSIIP